jgi:hypothetical protein
MSTRDRSKYISEKKIAAGAKGWHHCHLWDDSEHLTNVRTSSACYRDNFTFLIPLSTNVSIFVRHKDSEIFSVTDYQLRKKCISVSSHSLTQRSLLIGQEHSALLTQSLFHLRQNRQWEMIRGHTDLLINIMLATVPGNSTETPVTLHNSQCIILKVQFRKTPDRSNWLRYDEPISDDTWPEGAFG